MSTPNAWGTEIMAPSGIFRSRKITSAFLPLPCARFVSAVRPDSRFLFSASVFLLPAVPASVLSPSAISTVQQPKEELSCLSLSTASTRHVSGQASEGLHGGKNFQQLYPLLALR